MVSVGVSALGTTIIHFIELGVKVNGQYCREDLLMQKLLPDIRQLSDFYVFQQDSVPASRARETIELLTMETPEFIPPMRWPPNSPDLNPVHYKVWSVMQEKFYKKQIKDIDELRARILTAWDEMVSILLMQQSDSGCGAHVFVHALKPKAFTLNTH